ncbi:MAG: hypothetical protein ABI772_11650, partial [Bacteroidota bacterium]
QEKAKKGIYTDSTYFDAKEFALYSNTSGFENRFSTLKQCTLTYNTRKRNGLIILKKNKLPKTIEKIVYERSPKVVLKFTDIILLADSLNPSERKCPPFTVTYHYKRSWWLYFGASVRIPSPIPFLKYDKTTINYMESE